VYFCNPATGAADQGDQTGSEMPSKNGHQLTDRHLAILRAIQKLQPCSSGEVVRSTGENYDFVKHTVFLTLSRRGLVQFATVRMKDKKPRRKTGTLRLTPEGEMAANGEKWHTLR